MRKPSTRPPGRPPDPKGREERRQQILGGARRCFTEKGFHAASMGAISKASGVSVANLYQYFPSKQDLILAIAEQDLESDFGIGQRLSGNLFERVEGLLTALAVEARHRNAASLRVEIVSESMRNREMADAMVRLDSELARHVASEVTKAQQSGDVAGDLDPAIVASMILRLVDGFYVAAGLGLIDPEVMVPHLGLLLRRGLAPSARQRR